MTCRSLISVYLCVATLVTACAGTARLTADQVLDELSRRSSMPRSNLEPLLANCSADQQSMYFCAYRDSVAADLTLKLAVANKQRETPACKEVIERMIADFEGTRDRQCAEAAAADYGGGSMEPTATATCVAASTNDMVVQVEQVQCTQR